MALPGDIGDSDLIGILKSHGGFNDEKSRYVCVIRIGRVEKYLHDKPIKMRKLTFVKNLFCF